VCTVQVGGTPQRLFPTARGQAVRALARAAQGLWIIETVKEDDFGDPTATLSVWNAAVRRVRTHARDAEINSEVPDFVAGILDRAESAGHGAEHIAAMVKVLRGAHSS
jgi:hypothetical protein